MIGSAIPTIVSTSGISSKPASKLRRIVAMIKVRKTKIAQKNIQMTAQITTIAVPIAISLLWPTSRMVGAINTRMGAL